MPIELIFCPNLFYNLGLSALAMSAPSEKFLNMGAPLAMGLGVVFVANIGAFFFPPGTALGAGKKFISSVYSKKILPDNPFLLELCINIDFA